MNIMIKSILSNSCVALAPMAGITDYVLRSLIRNESPDTILYTEMISSEALNQIKETDMIKRDKNHSPIIYQLSGHKPEMMAEQAKFLEPYADIIDINMGCPVNKIVRGQDGSALMKNPSLAYDIVKAVKESVSKPVSVKIRLGYTADTMNYVSFGEYMQEAGAELITIHARTRNQMYGGKADWNKIKDLKHSIDVPVLANGDIVSIETAEECMEKSEADGIAVGRGALGDVTLLHRIEHYFKTGEKLPCPTASEKIDMMKAHLDKEIELRGERVGIKYVRKFYPFYISDIPNAAKYRGKLVLIEDYKEISDSLDYIKNHV